MVDVLRHRRRIDPYLIDKCKITYDVKSERNEELDLVTLKYVSNLADENVYQGRCVVVQEQGAEGIFGVQVRPRIQTGSYTAILPAESPLIPNGSLFEVTQAQWDPSLLGMKFRVDSSPSGSFLVARLLFLSTRPDARDRR